MRRCEAIVWSLLLAAGAPAAGCGSRAMPLLHDAGSADGGAPANLCPMSCGAPDTDGDGHAAPPCGDDCNDFDPQVNPAAVDSSGDGVDSNCDGIDGVDVDGDGHAPAELGGDDCDDALATVRPGANDGEGWRIEPAGFGAFDTLRLDQWARPHVVSGFARAVSQCTESESCSLAIDSWRAGEWTSSPLVDDFACVASGHGLLARGRTLLLAYAVSTEPTSGFEVTLGFGPDPAWSLWTADRTWGDVDGVSDECGRVTVAYSAGTPEEPSLSVRGWDRDALPEIVDGSRAFAVKLARGPDGTSWLAYGIHRSPDDDPRTDAELRVANDGGGGWRVDVVDVPPCVDCLQHLDIAVDGAGEPHVVYATEEGTFYARRHRSGWEREVVDGTSESGLANGRGPDTVSIRVDSSGAAHVVYVAAEPEWGVRYATNRSGRWLSEALGPPLTPGYWVPGWPSMDVDSNDQVHVAWFDGHADVDAPLGVLLGGRYAILSRPNDGIDQNCDGVDGVDADGDGHASRETGGDDVDDDNPAR